MKITKIEAFHVSVPLAKPYVLSKRYGTLYSNHAVIAKIHTDEGICGYGEANPMPPFTGETWGSIFAAVKEYLGPCLLGQSPLDITRANVEFDRALPGNLLAKGALDVALWDVRGKAMGVPVHRLLGGALKTEIPLLWPFGSGTPKEDVERIAAKMEEGYRTFMIKMGALDIDTEIARALAREAAFDGTGINVNMDANQGWDLAEALTFMERTRDCHIDFVEQPLPRELRHLMPVVRERATHPLSADEGVQTVADAVALARQGSVDIFSLKIAKNGGITRAFKIAQLAEAFGIKCMMNSMIELGVSQAAALHLGAALPNLLTCGQCYMSTLRMKNDVTDFSGHIHRAVATVPDTPGLGIAVDDDKVKHYCDASIVV